MCPFVQFALILACFNVCAGYDISVSGLKRDQVVTSPFYGSTNLFLGATTMSNELAYACEDCEYYNRHRCRLWNVVINKPADSHCESLKLNHEEQIAILRDNGVFNHR